MKKCQLLWSLLFFVALGATAQQRVSLQPNQRLLAYNTSDDYDAQGVGFDVTGTVMPCIYITEAMTEKFVGCQITAIRFAVTKPVGKATVFVREMTAQGGFGASDLASAEIAQTVTGWNQATLSTPLTIEQGKRYFLGYKFRNTNSLYGMAVVQPVVDNSSYCYGKLSTNGIGLYDISDNGTLCVQAIVEGDLAGYDAIVNEVQLPSLYTEKGGGLDYSFRAINYSSEPATITYALLVDQQEIATVTGQEGLEPSAGETVNGTLTMPTSVQPGTHTFSVSVKSINGEAFTPTNYSVASMQFSIIDQIFPRQKQLVDHLTSNACTYCPWGDDFLSSLEAVRGDIVRVSAHGILSYKNPDPMNNNYVEQLNSLLGLEGWPSGAINRQPGMLGTKVLGNIAYGYDEGVAGDISNDIDAFVAASPTIATIRITPTLGDDRKSLTLTVSGQIARGHEMIVPNASLYVCLVEDELVSPQYNVGTWVYDYVHNNVLRTYLTSVYGNAITARDGQYEQTFTTTLSDEWDASHMRAVAFIAPRANSGSMVVNNCEAVSLTATAATDIQAPVTTERAAAGCFNAAGQRIATPQRGLNILRDATGRARKVYSR